MKHVTMIFESLPLKIIQMIVSSKTHLPLDYQINLIFILYIAESIYQFMYADSLLAIGFCWIGIYGLYVMYSNELNQIQLFEIVYSYLQNINGLIYVISTFYELKQKSEMGWDEWGDCRGIGFLFLICMSLVYLHQLNHLKMYCNYLKQ
eukprot:NODE_194_length_13294_cov_0.803714.p10 type:complete len:149 gc:universal NODE_194_length_13294_cov_0.803714:4678-5124(+)